MTQDATAACVDIFADAVAVIEEPEIVELYYVEEHEKRVFESADIYICLRVARELHHSAKVKRQSDGVLLAYRTKNCLTATELAEDAAGEDVEVQNASQTGGPPE